MNPRELTLSLLAARAPKATVCPSEVARALASQSNAANWRNAMPAVHCAIDEMVAEGVVRLSWKGKTLKARGGPYRIGRGTTGEP